MQRAIEQAVEALGPAGVFYEASRAADALHRACLLGVYGATNKDAMDALATALAEMDIASEMLRQLAGPGLVDLAKVESLFNLQQSLNQPLVQHVSLRRNPKGM